MIHSCLIFMLAAAGQPPAASREPIDWRTAEGPMLANHRQITSREQFIKAGEAYFSPDSRWIIFQAVPVPTQGEEPSPHYAMFIAPIERDAGGTITGLGDAVQISPPGSANTCGWFDASSPGRVIYGSTMTPPSETTAPGYQGPSRRYAWSFPREMEVVAQTPLPLARAVAAQAGRPFDPSSCAATMLAAPIFERDGYDAECTTSGDGSFIVYTHVEETKIEGTDEKRADADIWVYDVRRGTHAPLVVAPGYDGGPFLSPDGARLCYRSDRRGDDRLQVFIATLKQAPDGVPVGIEAERQLTDNEHVNWGPYWHPSGSFLLYATSEVGHANYEVFAIDAREPAGTPVRRRVTFADGADVLPAFNSDGSLMMWTSQRGAAIRGEARPSSQLWIAEWAGGDAPNVFGTGGR